MFDASRQNRLLCLFRFAAEVATSGTNSRGQEGPNGGATNDRPGSFLGQSSVSVYLAVEPMSVTWLPVWATGFPE